MSRLSRLLRHVTGLLPTAPAGPSDRELAETAEREGRLREAAAARVRLGEFGAAADLLDHAGDAGLAAVLRAQHCLGAGDLRGAAQALEVAADPDGCAALWRELGENERAAEVLERSGRWAQAAIAWEQCDGGERRAVGAWDAAGGHGRAADLLQRLGDRPAELIQRDKAEQWLRAGELRIAAGELAEAEDCLKRVAEQSPDWRAGRLLLGDVHELLDRPLEAATCYAQAIADEPVDARNVATYYLAGRCALDAGRPDLADTHLQVVWV